MIADHTPTALGGLPEGAPQRSARPSAYPAVHDMPPRRGSVLLTDTEQKKLEDNPSRVDFMAFCDGERHIIEIDGPSHYATLDAGTYVVDERAYARQPQDRSLPR